MRNGHIAPSATRPPMEFIKTPSVNPADRWPEEREVRPRAGPTLGARSAQVPGELIV